MKKGISIPLCIILILSSFFVACQYMNAKKLEEYETVINLLSEQTNRYKTLKEIDSIVRENHLNDIDEQALEQGLISGYIYGLDDRYAYYYPPEDMEQYNTENEGKMTGIGVRVIYDNSYGGIYITAVMPNSPALESGLKARDIIVAAEGQLVSEIGYYQAINVIKGGEENSTVNLTVARAPDYETIEEIPVIRREIDNTTVFSEMLDANTAFITITEFNRTTSEEVKVAVDTAISQNQAKRIVFDVRNNPGGDLIGVAGALDYLLPEGPIIHIVSKEGIDSTITSAPGSIEIPMVVLINENTASAGELFCSALKDYGKAVLVGTKTFGKGSMQTIVSLSNGGGISFTTNRYDPPYSENYDGVGVEPDIESHLTDEQSLRFYDLSFDEDPQILDALNAFERFDEICAKNNKHTK